MRLLPLLILCFVTAGATALDDRDIRIKGQKELTTNQGQPITLRLSDFYVEVDGNSSYPNGYHLRVFDGKDYRVSGTTVIPDDDFTGTLRVQVQVYNDREKSEKEKIRIEVRRASQPSNQRPVITGQQNLSIDQGDEISLSFSHLYVNDPDDNYPEGFTLRIFDDDDYRVDGRTIEPDNDFTGVLSVRVRVNDGKDDSPDFTLKINVIAEEPENVKPVITAQAGLTTFKNEPISLRLTDLSVTDPDNKFPDDFRLKVSDGSNYSVSGSEIQPASGFTGTLSVSVRVNDGSDDSNPFTVRISVIERGELTIVGQKPLQVKEDSSLAISLDHLRVTDPVDGYPSGFSLVISDGENFSIDGNRVVPGKDFNGDLFVKVNVRKGNFTSKPYELLISVMPVNDPPFFEVFDTRHGALSGGNTVSVSEEVVVADVDDDELFYAEVSFDPDTYEPGQDELLFDGSEKIRGVFDAATGLLLFVGTASLSEYQEVLRSVKYRWAGSSDSVSVKRLRFHLNDGEASGDVYEKVLVSDDAGDNLLFEIPTGFTPNNDNTNDTWVIGSRDGGSFEEVAIRVYDRRGRIVFESESLDTAWDGRHNGELLPPDSYFYTLSVTRQQKVVNMKGTVTILR